MPYNTQTVSELINAAFSLSELKDFCFFHFRPVYDNHRETDRKADLVRILIEHADHSGQLGYLLKRIQEANPNQYANFSERLTEVEPKTKPVNPPIPNDQYTAGQDIMINQRKSPTAGLPNTKFWVWVLAIGAIIVIIAGIIGSVSDGLNILRPPVSTESTPQASDFIIEVVRDDTGEPIPQIEVSLRIEGSDFVLSERTDNSGVARFPNVLTHQKTAGFISIFSESYEEHEENLTIDRDNPFVEIRLQRK